MNPLVMDFYIEEWFCGSSVRVPYPTGLPSKWYINVLPETRQKMYVVFWKASPVLLWGYLGICVCDTKGKENKKNLNNFPFGLVGQKMKPSIHCYV